MAPRVSTGVPMARESAACTSARRPCQSMKKGPTSAAAHNAVILEAVARMAYYTLSINQNADAVGKTLHDKHYLRKHGSQAYYGQLKDPK